MMSMPGSIVQVKTVKKVKRKSNKASGPSINAISYNGPTRVSKGIQANDTQLIQMGYGGTLTTSAGGVLASVLDSSASATSSQDWAQAAAMYKEYRILSYTVKFVPWNKYNQPTTSALAPVWSIVDRADNTAVASISSASSNESAELHDPSETFQRVVKMSGQDEAQWILTSATPASSSRLYIKLYSAGNVASTNLYDYFAVVLVQFRGRA